MHFFPSNRRISAAAGEAMFRRERTEQEVKQAVEFLKKVSPSQA